MIIANKYDLVAQGETPEVSESEIKEFETRTGKKVFNASAKSGDNVESTFLKLTEILIEKHKPSGVSDGSSYAKPGDGSTVLFTTKDSQSHASYCGSYCL